MQVCSEGGNQLVSSELTCTYDLCTLHGLSKTTVNILKIENGAPKSLPWFTLVRATFGNHFHMQRFVFIIIGSSCADNKKRNSTGMKSFTQAQSRFTHAQLMIGIIIRFLLERVLLSSSYRSDGCFSGENGLPPPFQRDRQILNGQTCYLYYASEWNVLPQTHCRGKISWCFAYSAFSKSSLQSTWTNLITATIDGGYEQIFRTPTRNSSP